MLVPHHYMISNSDSDIWWFKNLILQSISHYFFLLFDPQNIIIFLIHLLCVAIYLFTCLYSARFCSDQLSVVCASKVLLAGKLQSDLWWTNCSMSALITWLKGVSLVHCLLFSHHSTENGYQFVMWQFASRKIINMQKYFFKHFCGYRHHHLFNRDCYVTF